MTEPLKILFSGDTSNRTNWGCRATTESLREVLSRNGEIYYTVDTSNFDKHISKQYLHERPTYWYGNDHLSTRPPFPRKHPTTLDIVDRFQVAISSRLKPTQLHKRITKREDIIRESKRIARRRCPLMQAIDECDAVIINGEGAFIPTGFRAGLHHLTLAYLSSVICKKPTAIVNHTCDISHPLLYELVELVYPQLENIAVREACSYRALSRLLGSESNLSLIPDTVFTMRPCSQELWLTLNEQAGYFSAAPTLATNKTTLEGRICIGGSAEFRFNPDKRIDLISTYTELCTRLKRIAPLVLISIEHQEQSFMEHVAHRTGVPLVHCTTPVQQGLDILGNSLLYVGGRWHSAIKAAAGGTPSVLFGTNSDYKTKGFNELLDFETTGVPFNDLPERTEDVKQEAEKKINQGKELRTRTKGTALGLGARVHPQYDALISGLVSK